MATQDALLPVDLSSHEVSARNSTMNKTQNLKRKSEDLNSKHSSANSGEHDAMIKIAQKYGLQNTIARI
jgi:hypothetical protein